MRISGCVCLSLISSRLFQIGTGFKDEDLEQHYKFLKVKWRCVTGSEWPDLKTTSQHLFPLTDAIFFKKSELLIVTQLQLLELNYFRVYKSLNWFC